MKRVLAAIWVLACLATSVSSRGQSAADAFKDLPANHWAYSVADQLRARGVITGYPEAYFKGNRALTRYEFALAIDRAFGRIATRGERSAPGGAAPLNEPVDSTLGALTTGDVDALRRLAAEFQTELEIVGTSPAAVKSKIERLLRDIEARKHAAARAARLSTSAALRTESGTRVASRAATFSWPNVSQPDALKPAAGGATTRVSVGVLPQNGGSATSSILGAGYATLGAPARSLDLLDARPMQVALGPATSLNVERLRYSLGSLALSPPRAERSFTDPSRDESPFGVDGLRFAAHVGSVVVEAFAGQTYAVSGTLGMNPERSLLGPAGAVGILPSTTPSIALAPTAPTSQFSVRQLGGVSLRFPVAIFSGGHVRLTGIGSTGSASGGDPGTSLLGAETELRVTPRLTLGGEWARTMSASPMRFVGLDGQNSAYSGTLGYNSGRLRLTAEYKYIDPLFYAPGYWGRIGGWLNPTNIQGPGFRAAYEGGGFGVTLGGDFFSGARNRDDLAALGTNDDMTRVLVGVRWDVSRNLRANLDWEGVYWRLNSSLANLPTLAGNATPREQYITISTGYNLSSSTLLRLGYQRGGLVNSAAGAGGSSSVSAFTGQMAIKF